MRPTSTTFGRSGVQRGIGVWIERARPIDVRDFVANVGDAVADSESEAEDAYHRGRRYGSQDGRRAAAKEILEFVTSDCQVPEALIAKLKSMTK